MAVLDDSSLQLLFLDARTHRQWLDRPVDVALLRRMYDLARWPPTSANSEPMRIVFVNSAGAKERLAEAAEAGGLARAGGPAQGQDLAFLEREGERVEDGGRPHVAGEPDDLEDLHARRITAS